MHGDEQQMGTFNVSFIDENDNLHSFITSGDHDNTWHPCHVSVTSQHMFKVRNSSDFLKHLRTFNGRPTLKFITV